MNWDRVVAEDVLRIKTSSSSVNKFCNRGRTCTLKQLIRENGKVVSVVVYLHCTTEKTPTDFGVTHPVHFPVLGRFVKVSRKSVVLPANLFEFVGKPNSLAY